ncbi:hypothetical protein AB5I41_14455 [Sphingomonas sp. MMS24-JH45]
MIAMSPMLDLDRELESTTKRIGDIPGVRGIQTSLSVQAVKYNIRTAKILSPQVDLDEPEDDG